MPPPLWSAAAVEAAPHQLSAIHADYVMAGAEVHTAATFRTRRRAAGEDWRRLTERAVHLARAELAPGMLLAGSIAPLEDCYHPDRSPLATGVEHAELAAELVTLGCDLLLCETFPCVREGLEATAAAVGRGVPVWTSFTAGYRGDLLSPGAVGEGARQAVERGAAAVLVNCVPAEQTLAYVRALVAAVGDAVPVGAYANAGSPGRGLGWGRGAEGADQYVALAEQWVDAGASLVGGCCGTEPATIAALRRRWPLHTSTHVRKEDATGRP